MPLDCVRTGMNRFVVSDMDLRRVLAKLVVYAHRVRDFRVFRNRLSRGGSGVAPDFAADRSGTSALQHLQSVLLAFGHVRGRKSRVWRRFVAIITVSRLGVVAAAFVAPRPRRHGSSRARRSIRPSTCVAA